MSEKEKSKSKSKSEKKVVKAEKKPIKVEKAEKKKCEYCKKPLVPIGSERSNGTYRHGDWDGRKRKRRSGSKISKGIFSRHQSERTRNHL